MTYQQGGQGYGSEQQPAYGQQQYQQAPQQYGQQQYGYGQQQQQYGYQQPAPRQGLPVNLWQYLVYAIGALGVVNLFIGFAGAIDVKGGDLSGNNLYLRFGTAALVILAAAGLTALTSLLPNQSRHAGFVAAGSVVGALVALFSILTLPGSDSSEGSIDAGIGLILLCVFGFLQAAVAVAWLLVESDVIKTGPQAPAAPDAYAQQLAAQQGGAQQGAAPSSAQQYGQAQTYSQAQGYGQPQGYGQAGGYGQTTAVGYGQSSPQSTGPSTAQQSAQSAAAPYSQAGQPSAPSTDAGSDAGTSIINTAGTSAGSAGDAATTAIGGTYGQHSSAAESAGNDAADKLQKPQGQ